MVHGYTGISSTSLSGGREEKKGGERGGGGKRGRYRGEGSLK
jgi:hypothetical protein